MDIPLTVFKPKTQSLSINLFPNPAKNTLSVLPNEMLKENYSVILFDALGKQVLKQNLTTANETLDVSHLPTGIYVVNISSENKVFQTKIIKE